MACALLERVSMKPLALHHLAHAVGGAGFPKPTFPRTPSWGPFGKSPYESRYGTWKTTEDGVRVFTPTVPFIWGK
jgi:hypothetical protein